MNKAFYSSLMLLISALSIPLSAMDVATQGPQSSKSSTASYLSLLELAGDSSSLFSIIPQDVIWLIEENLHPELAKIIDQAKTVHEIIEYLQNKSFSPVVVGQLLKRKFGTDINKTSRTTILNVTALHDAVAIGHTQVVQALIMAGADINKVDIRDWTPLHLAIWKGHVECVNMLITAGADIHKVDRRGWMLLHLAVESGHLECVNTLITAGAIIHKADHDGRTPLHLSAYWGHVGCVQTLIAAGADINKANNYGETSLHESAFCGRVCCVKVLIAAGADINKTDNKSKTALNLAQERHQSEIVALLQPPLYQRIFSWVQK